MTKDKRLRIMHVVVQPVIVWDNGEELEIGPQIDALTMPVSQLAEFAANLPQQVAALAEKLDQSLNVDATG